jgi:hypothetical protein
MNDNKTLSMLQRVPVILAVTAASYGLPLQAQATQMRGATAQSVSRSAAAAPAAPAARLVRQR